MLRTPLLSSTFFTSPKCFKRTRDVKARALSINNNVEDVLKIQKDRKDESILGSYRWTSGKSVYKSYIGTREKA